VASWFIETGMMLGLYTIVLRVIDGQKTKFDDLFSKFDVMLMLKYFAASFLVGLAVIGGLILLIIPGIIIALRLGFYSYLLVDKKLGPIEAFKTSWKMTKGHTKDLFLLGLCIIGINILGLLAFGVGLLVSAPVSSLAFAYAYRKLATK
jgi:uncharacterized membrane protein